MSIGWRKTIAIFVYGVLGGPLVSNVFLPQNYGCGNYALVFAHLVFTILVTVFGSKNTF